MKVKEESEKFGLKLNIQKTKIMASGPISSWETDGETVETVSDCIFLGSKITADGDCSHEIKVVIFKNSSPHSIMTVKWYFSLTLFYIFSCGLFSVVVVVAAAVAMFA